MYTVSGTKASRAHRTMTLSRGGVVFPLKQISVSPFGNTTESLVGMDTITELSAQAVVSIKRVESICTNQQYTVIV